MGPWFQMQNCVLNIRRKKGRRSDLYRLVIYQHTYFLVSGKGDLFTVISCQSGISFPFSFLFRIFWVAPRGRSRAGKGSDSSNSPAKKRNASFVSHWRPHSINALCVRWFGFLIIIQAFNHTYLESGVKILKAKPVNWTCPSYLVSWRLGKPPKKTKKKKKEKEKGL